MEAPKPMIDAMVATSSADIHWVNSDTAGLKRPPSIAEWEDASCGSFTSEEWDAYSKLVGKPTRSAQEQLFLKFLSEKLQANGMCKNNLYDAQRDRLAPP
jgi:hypothetical protein